MSNPILPDYPKTLRGAAEGEEITLRLMTRSDGSGVLGFVQALSKHDLLFLRRDISQPVGVDAWLRDLEQGVETSIVAERGTEVVGFASVQRSGLDWSRHVAEVHAMTAAAVRGQGVGRELVLGAVRTALGLGIEKLYARMTLDQMGARTLFERLGFRPEALLRADVKDRDGASHDVLVLSNHLLESATALDRLLDARAAQTITEG